MINIVAAYRL